MTLGAGRCRAIMAARRIRTNVAAGEANHDVPAERGGQAGGEGGEHGCAELPAPAQPWPPWCCGGYHCDASSGATAGDAPAKPEQPAAVPALFTPSSQAAARAAMTMTGRGCGALRRPAIGQQAEQEAQYGAGEDRRGDHHRALLGAQLQVAGNLHPQRAEHVPDHEAQVEINAANRVGAWPAFRTIVHRTPRIQRNRGGTAARRKLHRYKGERPTADHPPAPTLGRNDEDATGLCREGRPRDVFVGGW